MSEPVPQTAATAAPKFEVYHDAARAERGLAPYSFRVDGQESLYWSPTEHAANRVISRLKLGRSMEAFGGSGVAAAGTQAATAFAPGRPREGRGKVVTAGEVATELVETKSGRKKPREKRPAWLFELDGKAYEHVKVTSEADAKALCAIEAFRTRGRLNPARHAEAEAQFREQHGKDCKVHQVGRKVVAKDADGMLWLVGFESDGGCRFKPARDAIREQAGGGQ